jgi:hypothetical protein
MRLAITGSQLSNATQFNISMTPLESQLMPEEAQMETDADHGTSSVQDLMLFLLRQAHDLNGMSRGEQNAVLGAVRFRLMFSGDVTKRRLIGRMTHLSLSLKTRFYNGNSSRSPQPTRNRSLQSSQTRGNMAAISGRVIHERGEE